MDIKFEISKDFLSSLQWIRLDDLFNLPYEELPQWVWTSNVIYYCRNTYNGKGYIGETKQCLVDRWRGNGIMNHQFCIKNSDYIIYKAIRKYTPNKFILSIIQCNFDSDKNRMESEINWIKVLHTYKSEYGYNMTYGGDGGNAEYMITKENEYKASFGRIIGRIHLNISELRKNNLELNGKNYINYIKSYTYNLSHINSIIKYYNDIINDERVVNYKDLINDIINEYNLLMQKSSIDRALETTMYKNGGVLAWNTKESINKSQDTRRKIGNGDCMSSCHAPAARNAASITRLFNRIISVIDNCNSLDDYKSTYASIITAENSLNVIRYYLDQMKNDGRWTSKMSEIFKDL